MEEDIKILEEFIKEPQAEYEEVYVDGKLISKLELLPIDFKPTKEVSQAIESLLKAYKQDEKVIDLFAEQLSGLAIFDNDIEEPLILGDKEEVKEYFRKQVKTNE